MAKIIQFPANKAGNRKENAARQMDRSAEIIIFPGIRFEHHGVSFAMAK